MGAVFENKLDINTGENMRYVVLAGNPNTGKSTIFNSLTGLKQHTGNWTGKTVSGAKGRYTFNDETFYVVDLPGIYSLNPKSADEYAAYEHLKDNTGVTVIVLDATCIERNLILAFQIMKHCGNVILCLNLMDEAVKKKIRIDVSGLGRLLGIPVIAASAKQNIGIEELKQAIYDAHAVSVSGQKCPSARFCFGCTIEEITGFAKKIVEMTVVFEIEDYNSFDRKIDDVVMSRLFGIPIMLGLLFLAFWLTISVANYPSSFLMHIFNVFEGVLYNFLIAVKCPGLIADALVNGVYRVLTWVIAVMLPPMAIFYPLFTILEDFGLLPRIAFNMDGCFRRAGAHGKQALTM